MKPPKDWEEIIDGIRYSTKSSVLIARGDDRTIDKDEPVDWNLFLYRTAEWKYFTISLNPSSGSQRMIVPISKIEALNIFGTLTEQCVDLEDAFPDRGTGPEPHKIPR